MDLAEIKKVSKKDLHNFLTLDHTSFTVLSISTKHIESTNRLSVSLTKNSANSFYLGKENRQKSPASPAFLASYGTPNPIDDCLKDAQNCSYFQFFNSKEKKLYTRFKDKVEANFEGNQANQPVLFLTLTFNTTHNHYFSWTTNWDKEDNCWNTLNGKQSWLKDWAQDFDPQAEPFKIQLLKIPQEQASNFTTASQCLTKFLRQIRLKWKLSHWKWVVVAELQKPKNNRPATWHFHLLSTPIVPYSHKCTLDKNFKSCWNCRTYLSELWPYGRVESRSPGPKTISSYLAKYLAKSFHLRSLYQHHGFSANNKAYRFFKNLYEYEEREALIRGKSKLDHATQQYLNGNQKVFRRSDNSYYYRTNEKLIGKCAKPTLIKKNYRLGTRSLNPLSLLELAHPDKKKPVINLSKLKNPLVQSDFQTFLITHLLLLCKQAEFLHTPLEQERVPKEMGACNQSLTNHFRTKSVLCFQFAPENTVSVRQFIQQLDTYAQEYDLEESKDFYFYPPRHNSEHQTTQQSESCGCENQARNQYLNNWALNYFYPSADNWRRTPL